MALDQPLDSIIKANKKNSRRVGRKPVEKKKVSSVSKGKKTAITGKASKPAAAAAAASAASSTSAATAAALGNKINISNLPPDVKEAEVRELFAKTIGPLREVTLHFDAKGKSKGMGSVVFTRKGDAAKAVSMYHNRLIDGNRQMKVELVLQAGQAPAPPTLAERVAPAVATGSAAPKKSPKVAVAAKKQALKRRTRKPRAKAVPVTAADLDAQMEDYNAAGASTAVGASA